MENVILWALKLGFGIGGIVFLGISVGLKITCAKKRKSCTRPVTAEVVDIEKSESWSSDGYRSVSWFPVYEYYAGGQLIRKRSFVGSGRQRVHVGQKLTLYLNPKDVDEYYCEKDDAGFVSVIFGVVGVTLLVVAGIVVFIEYHLL